MLSCGRENALQGALVLARSRRLELGDNILRTFKHCDIMGRQIYGIRWGKTQKKSYLTA